MTTINCKKYLEDFYENEADEYIQESYWERSFNSDTLFDKMIRHAKNNGYSLADEEEWDYDNFFWDMYKYAEKGLS